MIIKKTIFALVAMGAFSVNGFAKNANNEDKKVKEEFTECCGSRKTIGTPGKANYMVFTAYRCATSNTSLNAKTAACALADADTTSAQNNATTKVTLQISQ